MALITLIDAQLAFGHVALLDHTDFSLELGERVGIIGRNGAGKSSMLKIIAGLEKIDDGTLQLQNNLRMAYVSQEPDLDLNATIFEAVKVGIAPVIALMDEYMTGAGDASLARERLTRHGGAVDQLVTDDLAEQFVFWQAVEQFLVGQLRHLTATVHQDHLLEMFVGVRIPDDRQPGRQAGAGAEQVEALAGVQVVDQQGAGGFAAHQPRGQRAVGHLDAEEVQALLPVRAGDGVGAQQRLAVDRQADHHEVAVGKPEGRVAGGGEAEQPIGPVVDLGDGFFVEGFHRGGRVCGGRQAGGQKGGERRHHPSRGTRGTLEGTLI